MRVVLKHVCCRSARRAGHPLDEAGHPEPGRHHLFSVQRVIRPCERRMDRAVELPRWHACDERRTLIRPIGRLEPQPRTIRLARPRRAATYIPPDARAMATGTPTLRIQIGGPGDRDH